MSRKRRTSHRPLGCWRRNQNGLIRILAFAPEGRGDPKNYPCSDQMGSMGSLLFAKNEFPSISPPEHHKSRAHMRGNERFASMFAVRTLSPTCSGERKVGGFLNHD